VSEVTTRSVEAITDEVPSLKVAYPYTPALSPSSLSSCAICELAVNEKSAGVAGTVDGGCVIHETDVTTTAVRLALTELELTSTAVLAPAVAPLPSVTVVEPDARPVTIAPDTLATAASLDANVTRLVTSRSLTVVSPSPPKSATSVSSPVW